MENKTEIWFYEYTLTHESVTRAFISVCAHDTKVSAIKAGKRHAAKIGDMTFIGVVKFIREEVAA
jgi:hypothetical protein